jgi:cell division protein FtsN
MARDYKHRAQNSRYASNRTRKKEPGKAIWRWLAIIVLIVVFVVFLNMIWKMVAELISAKPETEKHQVSENLTQDSVIEVKKTEKISEQSNKDTEEPRYDFYTILPQEEIEVPDYEIKTRIREELVGKSKAAKYIMQAGSFRDASEAEHQKAKLAQLGIESRIEKAKVGTVIWHRVKIGPYDNPSSVSTIMELLKKNGLGVIVTESGQH